MLGNILLADQGMTIDNEDLGAVPQPHLQVVHSPGDQACGRTDPTNVPPRYRPRLAEGPVSQIAPFDENAGSAFASTHPDPTSRRPKVEGSSKETV